MDSPEAVARVVDELERAEIPYMLVGALSSNLYGIPRSTKDADIVVAADSDGVLGLARSLGDEFVLDRQMRFETQTHSVRNILAFRPTGYEIELFRLSRDPHHQERFSRRVRRRIVEIGREAWTQTAEDVIIQKLRWQRHKDLDDIENILVVRRNQLDWEYLKRWTVEHGTWEKLNSFG